MEDYQQNFPQSSPPSQWESLKHTVQEIFRSKRTKKAGWIVFGIVLTGFVFVLSLFGLVYFGVFGKLPEREELTNIQHNNASQIYSSDGKLLGKFYIENRSNVAYEDMAPHLLTALVATEDARFFDHAGIDTKSMFRVAFKSLLLGDRSSGGGSTISQQLAKNLFPREDFGILSLPVAKFKEMIIAKRLEKEYSKEEILALYLNTVPFGEKAYGIGVASQRFFNTTPKDISVENAAVLVGMLKATTTYNPRRNPIKSQERRNVVLELMHKNGYLGKVLVDSLKELPIKVDYKKYTPVEGSATYFRQQVAEELNQWFKKNPLPDGKIPNVYTDGLKIHTTIDSRLQAYAEDAMETHMKELQKTFEKHWKGRELFKDNEPQILKAMRQSERYKSLKQDGKSEAEILKHFQTPTKIKLWTWEGKVEKEMSPLDSIKFHNSYLHAGFMAMNPKNGFIKVWVGGINFQQFKYDHVTSRRQVGSTFKPFVYTAALMKGVDPCEYIENQKVIYEDYENWAPGNADENYEGYYSMQGGLTKSVNTVSAAVMNKVGVDDAYKVIDRFGFISEIPKAPSMVLGTAELSLMEMLTAYTVFARQGKLTKPILVKRVEDREGNLIAEFGKNLDPPRIISEKTATMMNHMLQSVVENGTGRRLRSRYGLTNQIGGKTGTTQDQTDGWFIGITPTLVAGAWVGGETRKVRFRSLSLGQGANTALPIYGEFMRRYYRLYPSHKTRRFQSLDKDSRKALNCEMYLDEPPGKGLEDFFLLLKQKRMERHIRNMEKKMERKLDRNRPRPRKKKRKSIFKRNYRN